MTAAIVAFAATAKEFSFEIWGSLESMIICSS